MIDKQAIYHKTPKGVEAIANRQSGLAPKLRSLLIMIDGKRGYTELAAMSLVVGDCEQMLLQLAQDGFIEPVGGAVPASTASAHAVSSMANTEPAPLMVVSLPEAKRFTARLLTDLLGPSAEVLCMKIETAKNLAEFVAAVKRAREIVRDVKGNSGAENFIAQVELHTPGS
ncbi:hypothetical protein [Polaromonas sp.]|uniref:hypothetical protein n=1 Tax=Polaromonas sp. TaxID=1869339 RepID=UPI003265F973